MTNEALRTLFPIAGWPEQRVNDLEITGDSDPILPTPFRIGETSTAALAVVGLAVSDLPNRSAGVSEPPAGRIAIHQ